MYNTGYWQWTPEQKEGSGLRVDNQQAQSYFRHDSFNPGCLASTIWHRECFVSECLNKMLSSEWQSHQLILTLKELVHVFQVKAIILIQIPD